MNILFISRYFSPHIGGVEKHVEEVSKRLVKKGHRITVICEQNENTSEEKTRDRILVYRIKYPHKKFLGLFIIWWWFIRNRNYISKADIIHLHDVFIWYLPFRFLFPKKQVFSTFHGWEGIYPIPIKYKFIRKLSANLSTGVICVGKYVEKWYGIKADKIIYGAVDVSRVVPNYKKHGKRVLYLGRLDVDTGVTAYIQAFKILKQRFPDMKFEFLGDGKLKANAQGIGLVHGFQQKINTYLESCRFVCTSGYLSMLEALNAKRLVVSVSQSPLKFDILSLSPFEDYTIHCTSPFEIAKKIEFFLKHPDDESKIIKSGYKWAKEQTWEKVVESYLDLWKKQR